MTELGQRGQSKAAFDLTVLFTAMHLSFRHLKLKVGLKKGFSDQGEDIAIFLFVFLLSLVLRSEAKRKTKHSRVLKDKQCAQQRNKVMLLKVCGFVSYCMWSYSEHIRYSLV